MSRVLFEYSFALAAPSAAVDARDFGTPATPMGARTDMLLNPITYDYVRTDNGQWAETADSRTAMLCMLELEFGASPFSPNDGTRIKALKRTGDPITPEILQAETQRAAGILVAVGIISELDVQVRDDQGAELRDDAGRAAVVLRWRDLASGTPIDSTLSA